MYMFGVLLVGTLASMANALPACVCARDLRPVCGSDGKTYGNRCLLDCASSKNSSVRMVKAESCESEENKYCICTYEYKPVCGSDGETYPNQCSFQCEQRKQPALTERYRGACRSVRQAETPKKHSCACTRNLAPVCGSDGVSYSNRCMFNCARNTNPELRMLYEDECSKEVKETVKEQPCVCGRNLLPVCASNGKTYTNKCMLNCARATDPEIRMLHPRACDEEAKQDEAKPEPPKRHSCACTRIFQPVCATDNVTYSNTCMMKCAGEELAIRKHGHCDGP